MKELKKSLVVIRGLPGAGKNTFAELFKAPVCCADDYLMVDGKYVWTQAGVRIAHEKCEAKCKSLMEANEPLIIIANMNVKARDWRAYGKLAEEYGYMVFTVIVENRHGGKNSHGVTEEMLKDIEERFSIVLR
jgi:predicted kinase